jgi:alpha-1,2-mannosyltransferase
MLYYVPVRDSEMESLTSYQLVEFGISSAFYRLPTLVPLNIVLYNVFSPPHKGPNIYGTESWDFYLRNLLLNFHIFLPLALLSLPLFIALKLFSRQPLASGLRTLVFISPFYLWLAIFSAQPHKEERFMYPAYPALALNAAISLHILLAALGQSSPRTLIGRVPAGLKLLLVVGTLGTSMALGFSRIYGSYDAFSAPLRVYEPLQSPGVVGEGGASLCLGKDWYRFPTSYFLPEGMRAKFVKSEFRGLLPGEFASVDESGEKGWWPGTWRVPEGMNDENLEDVGKYVSLPSIPPYFCRMGEPDS